MFDPRRTINALIAVLTLAIATPLAAEEIQFINGDRLTGEIVRYGDESIDLETEHLGVVSIPRSAILDTALPVDVTLSTGTSSVYAAAPDPFEDWEAQADMGYVVSTGNTETTNISLIVGAQRSGERIDHVIGVNIAQAEADSSGSSVKTKDQFDLDYEFRWNASPTWYALGNVEYFADAIKDIDSRISVGLGGGRTFWKNDRGSLTSDLGVSQVFEQLANESENNPALRWGLRYGYWVRPDEIELFHDNQVLHILASDRGTVWSSGSGVRVYLNENWNAGLRVGLQYETKPNAGRGQTDTTISLTLGAKL